MTVEKEGLPKFPKMLPKEEGMLEVSRAWGYYQRMENWRKEVAEKLQYRLRLLNPTADSGNLYEDGYREGRRKLIKELKEN